LRAKGEELGDIPPWNGAMTDSDDRIFIEAALAGRADAVITGNIRHYPSNLGFDVLPPATLLARLGH
jgi:predicted nucleic acid-binding protein